MNERMPQFEPEEFEKMKLETREITSKIGEISEFNLEKETGEVQEDKDLKRQGYQPENLKNPELKEILERLEKNGVGGGCLGVISTSIQRLPNILKEGLKSSQSLEGTDYSHIDQYKNKNYIFFFPYKKYFTDHQNQEIGKTKEDFQIPKAGFYARETAYIDYLKSVFRDNGYDDISASKNVYQIYSKSNFISSDLNIDESAQKELTELLSKKLQPKEIQAVFEEVDTLSGVILGISKEVLDKFAIIESHEDRRALIIDLGKETSMPPEFIKGVLVSTSLNHREQDLYQQLKK